MAEETKTYMYDMHAHLDFAPRPKLLAQELEKRGIRVMSNTCQPASFVRATRELHDEPNVRIACGVHPWWTTDATGSAGPAILRVNALIDYMQYTPFVGEVGLDFRQQYVDCRDIQLVVFEDIMYACAKVGGMAVSIHCIKAFIDMFDFVETTGAHKNNTLILHSFCGSSDELQKCIELGFKFSIGERMLNTAKGVEYAKVIPADRLLLESDAPEMAPIGAPDRRDAAEMADAIEASLKNTLAKLEEIRGEKLAETIAHNSALILEY